MTRDEIKRVVGYVRVSTTEQGDFGVSLEAQREAIFLAEIIGGVIDSHTSL